MPNEGQIQKNKTTGEMRQWSGGGWQPIQMPPHQTSDRTDSQDLDTLKNFMTGAGSVGMSVLAPESIPMRIGAAAIGGALGRGVGHAIAAPTHSNGDASLTDDLGTGATEGAIGEAAPAGVGMGLRGAGRAAQAVGGAITKPAHYAGAAQVFTGHLPSGAATLAAPTILKKSGQGMQAIGDAMGPPKTTSQYVDDLWSWIKGKTGPTDDAATSQSFAPSPDRTMNTDRANPAGREIPYRAGSGADIPLPSLSDTPAAPPQTAFQKLVAEGRFQGDRTTGQFPKTHGDLADVAAGLVKPDPVYITDHMAGSPDVPGLTIGELPKPTPSRLVPTSQRRTDELIRNKFLSPGDLSPEELGEAPPAPPGLLDQAMQGMDKELGGDSSPWPPKPGQPGFGMQRTPARGSFTSQDSLLDLVNAKYPDINVTGLKDYPLPPGDDPLAKAIRQRAHAFGGK